MFPYPRFHTLSEFKYTFVMERGIGSAEGAGGANCDFDIDTHVPNHENRRMETTSPTSDKEAIEILAKVANSKDNSGAYSAYKYLKIYASIIGKGYK